MSIIESNDLNLVIGPLISSLQNTNGLLASNPSNIGPASYTLVLNGTSLSNSSSGLEINLANANTWTATQTFENVITTGWVWEKGRNRSYYNNPGFATTTSTTNSVVYSTYIIPQSSGHITINIGIVCFTNNASYDFINRVYSGASSGALTNLLTSNNYNNNNFETLPTFFYLSWELLNQTLNTELYITLTQTISNSLATAYCSIVFFILEEI